MTTEQQDTRNAYQYVMDSLALVEERGLSLSHAFFELGKTDHRIIVRVNETLKEIESLEDSESNREEIADLKRMRSAVMTRQATYMLISSFLTTDLFAGVVSPYCEEDSWAFCDCFKEEKGE